MQLSAFPASDTVRALVGPQLESLGATLVDTDDANHLVEVRFNDPKLAAVANGTFETKIGVVNVRYTDANGRGVRGIETGYAALDAIAGMEGVTDVAALESMPLQMSVFTRPDATAAVDMLLRDTSAANEPIRVG